MFIYLWKARGIFFQMGPNNLIILHAWVSMSHFCEREQNPVMTGIDIICLGVHQQSLES